MALLFQRKVKTNIIEKEQGRMLPKFFRHGWKFSRFSSKTEYTSPTSGSALAVLFMGLPKEIRAHERNGSWNNFMGRKSRTKPFTCNSTSNVLQPPNYPNPSLIFNKAGNWRKTKYWGAFVQPLLHWKSNKQYIFWVCVCSLGIQHAMPICHIFICDLFGSTIFFPHYLINSTIFERKVIEH